jgi:hypothetical protein
VRYSFEDTLDVGIEESFRIEAARDKLFAKLDEVVDKHLALQM